TELLVEKDPAWLNLSDSTPRWLPDGKSYFWATEEGSDRRLEHHYLEKKKIRRVTVLPGEVGFERLVHVDTERKLIWFLGGPDPRQTHRYRVSIEGGTPERISPEGGEHQAVFSADGSTFALTRTTLHDLPRTTVHRVDDLDGPIAAPTTLKRRPNEIAARA